MAMQEISDATPANVVQLRIVRGARALGSDGQIGTVQQIVVDQQTGELRAVVVRRESDSAEFELPVDLVQGAIGDEVRFTLARADLETRPELAQPYDPDQYMPLDQGSTAPRTAATRTAWDTEHPVVTSVEENAAELVAPARVAKAADTAGERTETQPTDTASPAVEGGAPASPRAGLEEGYLVEHDERDGGETTPLHEPLRGDIRQETTLPALPRQESAVPGTTGELLGGRPTTSGMGAAATPTSSTIPPYPAAGTEQGARAFGAPAQREPDGAPTGVAGEHADLTDLTDDELSNPDAALANPQADTAEEEQAGMVKAFRTATNTAADDTYAVRDVDVPAPQDGEAWRPAELLGTTAVYPLRWSEPALPLLSAQQPLRLTPRRQGTTAQRSESVPWWSTPLARGLAIGAVIGVIALVRRRRGKTA
jgi:sporulation protein YlmC with PRC-barrel domain